MLELGRTGPKVAGLGLTRGAITQIKTIQEERT